LRSESRSRIEYLMPTNNIIELDSCFNLTNKSNLTDRFNMIFYLRNDLYCVGWGVKLYSLTHSLRFFAYWVVAYFFGPPCINSIFYINICCFSINDFAYFLLIKRSIIS